MRSNKKRHSTLFRYRKALEDQPRQAILPEPLATIVPAVLAAVGQTFVVTSTWGLGMTGTFLGDYFGILMDHRVDGYASFLVLVKIYDDPNWSGSRSMFYGTQCTSAARCVSQQGHFGMEP